MSESFVTTLQYCTGTLLILVFGTVLAVPEVLRRRMKIDDPYGSSRRIISMSMIVQGVCMICSAVARPFHSPRLDSVLIALDSLALVFAIYALVSVIRDRQRQRASEQAKALAQGGDR